MIIFQLYVRKLKVINQNTFALHSKLFKYVFRKQFTEIHTLGTICPLLHGRLNFVLTGNPRLILCRSGSEKKQMLHTRLYLQSPPVMQGTPLLVSTSPQHFKILSYLNWPSQHKNILRMYTTLCMHSMLHVPF